MLAAKYLLIIILLLPELSRLASIMIVDIRFHISHIISLQTHIISHCQAISLIFSTALGRANKVGVSKERRRGL